MTKPAITSRVYPEKQELSGPRHARPPCRARLARDCAHSVVGVYDTMTQAETAVHALDHAGFPVKHISIVTQHLVRDTSIHGSITPDNDLSLRGATVGAWLGGLGSVLIGAAFFWAPGFGSLLVLGRLAVLLLASVEGACVGAAAGSFLGALVNWGIAEEHIMDYAQQVQGGKHLVIAYGTSADVAQAHAILQDTPAGSLHRHASRPV